MGFVPVLYDGGNMMKTISLILLMVALASVALAGHVPITIGEVEILYPVPDGFVEVVTHDKDLADAFATGTQPSNTMVGGFLTEKDWAEWVDYTIEDVASHFSPYFILHYLTESEHGVSAQRWNRFKFNVQTILTTMWDDFAQVYLGVLEEAQDAFSRLYDFPASFEVHSLVPLGITNESDTYLSCLWISSGQAELNGEVYPITQFQTSSMVFLKDRIIIMFAYMTKEKESDAEKLVELTDQWVAELVRINEKDFEGGSVDVSGAALKLSSGLE